MVQFYKNIGTFITAKGQKYEGDWVDDNKEGKGIGKYYNIGIQVDENGDKYEGDWKDNAKTGSGKNIIEYQDIK